VDTEQPWVVNSLTLAATPTAVPLARALVRLSLNRWGFRGLVDDAELVVSELTTNAVQASSTDLALIRVRIGLFAATTRIEIWDRAEGKPQPRPMDEAAEGGRGLLLVEALSNEWGWYAREGRFGKVVWAELMLPHEPISPCGLPAHNGQDLFVLQRVRDGLKRL
jgi:anti-sigma regulatory factor (Ser/Thr protein kinase)